MILLDACRLLTTWNRGSLGRGRMPGSPCLHFDHAIGPGNLEIHLTVKVCVNSQASGLFVKEFQIRVLELIAWFGIIDTIQFLTVFWLRWVRLLLEIRASKARRSAVLSVITT